MFGGRFEAVAMQFLKLGDRSGNVTLFRMESPEAARSALGRAAAVRDVRYSVRGPVVVRVSGPPEIQTALEKQMRER